MNKETMLMVAVAVALIATFYLYRENQKNKLDIKKLLETPTPAPVSKPILKKEKVQIPVTSTTVVADETE